MLVVGAEGFSGPAETAPSEDGTRSIEKSNKLKRAEDLNAQPGHRIEILSEEDFCRLAGITTPDALKRQFHAQRDLLARYRLLREDHLRYLVKCGIFRPVLRTNADTFFAFPDLAAIKHANDELGRGVAFRSIVRMLMASRDGQLAFDFRIEAQHAKVLQLKRREPPPMAALMDSPPPVDESSADQYFAAASILDDGNPENFEEASINYRRALEIDPYVVPALINLANIHYSRDEIAEAQALYERAIGLEPDVFEAHFNLGNIFHDLARYREAQGCYRDALKLNPAYADAHFYLAVTLEKKAVTNTLPGFGVLHDDEIPRLHEPHRSGMMRG